MKIIETNNLCGDYPDEKVVASGVPERFALTMCDALNEKFSGETATRFYKVEQDDYVLAPGFES